MHERLPSISVNPHFAAWRLIEYWEASRSSGGSHAGSRRPPWDRHRFDTGVLLRDRRMVEEAPSPEPASHELASQTSEAGDDQATALSASNMDPSAYLRGTCRRTSDVRDPTRLGDAGLAKAHSPRRELRLCRQRRIRLRTPSIPLGTLAVQRKE